MEKAICEDILVIAAVGNDENAGVMYPAVYDGVLAVGSVNTNAEHSDFSAKGEEVDVEEYCNGDYAKAYEHFVNIGFWEGRQASVYFDVNYYLNHYVDLQNAFGVNYLAAAQHFIWNGVNEGRYAAQEFRINDYMYYNQDLKNNYGQKLLSYYIHYSWIGWMEGRICTSDDE